MKYAYLYKNVSTNKAKYIFLLKQFFKVMLIGPDGKYRKINRKIF